MTKLLEAPPIEATTGPDVTGNLVAGLRRAVGDVRTGSVEGKTFALAGVLPTLSRDEACCRIEAAGGAIVPAVSAGPDYLVAGSEAGSELLKALDLGVPVIGEERLRAMLPLPFDSQEEAEPVTTDPPYRVCIKAHETDVGSTVPVGHVVELEAGESLQRLECWVPCDKDGWVASSHIGPVGLAIERRSGGQPGPSDWRPQRAPQSGLPTSHASAVPGSLAINKTAGRMGRRVAPTCGDVIPPALAVQEGGSHYKGMRIQPVEYIHANGLGFFEGNVVKYVSRWRAKGGLQDLKKARHYLDLLVELEGNAE